MFGHQRITQRFAIRRAASRHYRNWLNGRGIVTPEVAQHLVFPVRHTLADFLNRDDAFTQIHETHRMAGYAAGKRGNDVLWPLRNRRIPWQIE